MQHHPVFSRFRQYSGEIPPGYQLDFLGTQMYHGYFRGLLGVDQSPAVRTVRHFPYPPADEEYFEWIDLLESVVAASGSYTMIELGAGIGRWALRAAFAARQYDRNLDCHVIAVEPEPTVYGWMKKHFLRNGIKPSQRTLLHGAVTTQPGKVEFCVGGPRGGPYDLTPNAWYGQFVAQGRVASGEPLPDGEYCRFKALRYDNGWRVIRVPGITIKSILKKLDRVDLIDLDIEGQELPALTSAATEVDAKVKRMHIGTHSTEIEGGLRRLLSAHGWECHGDYPLSSTSETPWGPIRFENGAQSWVNPRF